MKIEINLILDSMKLPEVKSHIALPERVFGLLLPKKLSLSQSDPLHVCKTQHSCVTMNLQWEDLSMIAIQEDPTTSHKRHGMFKVLQLGGSKQNYYSWINI